MTTALLGQFDDRTDVELDIDTLVGSHLCISANSGAGKSGAIRKLLETTHGSLQHIVIDVEDEFYTLREKYEYLIAGGDNGDCAANVNNAEALANTILKAGISAIVQINNLEQDEREQFIATFLETLTRSPKALWRPLLLILDEAQFYAPQIGNAASSSAVINFMMLGRKRGFTGVLATPRAADLDKRATAPVNNWLVGRCGQPADRRAAAASVGFSDRSPEAIELRSLPARTFWAFGPALSLEPRKIKVGQTDTTIVKAGQATLPTPPAPAAMRKILEGPNAAAKDAENKAEAASSEGAKIKPDPQAIEDAEARGYAAGYENGMQDGRTEALEMGRQERVALADQVNRMIMAGEPVAPETAVPRPAPSEPPQPLPRAKIATPKGDGALAGAAPGLLAAIARGATSWEHAAVLAGLVPGNGYFYKGRKALVDGGYVIDGTLGVGLSAFGMRNVEPGQPPRLGEIISLWSAKLRSPGDQILRYLGARPKDWHSTEFMASELGIKPGNGYWYKGVKVAREAHLIDQDKGQFRLSEYLRSAPR